MNETNESVISGLRIEEDNFFIGVEAESYQEIIRCLANNFYEKGYVKETFIQAVLDREEVYPTGLEAPAGGIAIPHTDTEHVNVSAISLASLKKPVTFKVMAEPDRTVDVSIVMMLAVSDPKNIIPVLTKVISIVEDEAALSEIITTTSKKRAWEIVINHIKSKAS